ncbi:MAG: LytTR family DNA-binding domain-containing protein [Cyclobacteriaceae bacterium]
MKIIIVDDEPQAREIISHLLKAIDDVEVVAECDNGLDAIKAISELQPDLVFLDIQMPELNGFEVAEQINLEQAPYIIFVTAFDEYAIKAFEINAVDYILKPYDDDRFYQALERARDLLSTKSTADQQEIAHLLQVYNNSKTAVLRNLTVRSGSKIVFIEDRSIEWIEAADQYCNIHSSKGDYLVRESMRYYEEKLDPNLFFRAHRSSIINLSAIKELQPFKKGRYVVVLQSGQLVELGNSKLEALKKRMSQVRLSH